MRLQHRAPSPAPRLPPAPAWKLDTRAVVLSYSPVEQSCRASSSATVSSSAFEARSSSSSSMDSSSSSRSPISQSSWFSRSSHSVRHPAIRLRTLAPLSEPMRETDRWPLLRVCRQKPGSREDLIIGGACSNLALSPARCRSALSRAFDLRLRGLFSFHLSILCHTAAI